MRKFFAPLILSLFFFIPFKAYADTYNYTVYDSDLTFVNSSNFTTLKNTVESFVISNNLSSHYFVYRVGSISNPVYRVAIPTTAIENYCEMWFNNNSNLGFYFQCGGYAMGVYNVSSDFLSLSSNGPSSTVGYFYKNNSAPLYFNGDLKFHNGVSTTYGNTFIFTTNDNTYSLIPDSNSIFPTVSFLYDEWFGEPPAPPDNTPLLTTFYTVVIEKLVDVCTFFTSNYLYLTVFVIFLFYISILLLRRFIK